MKIIWIGLTLVWLAAIAAAVTEKGQDSYPSIVQQVVPADKLPGYPTLEEAGVHAIERAYKCSHVYECGGMIAQRQSDKLYVVGPVSSSMAGDHTHINNNVPIGYKPIADYHTHPCLPDSHVVPYFSDSDLAGNLFEHTIGIMGDLCTGKVHLFDPATMKPDQEKPEGTDVYVTQGRIIGQIQVEGVSVEPKQGML